MKPPLVYIDGVEWNVENMFERAKADPKLRACLRKGYRAGIGGEPNTSPNYDCDWRWLAWHAGWQIGVEERKKEIN
jgi:ribosome modulation factor